MDSGSARKEVATTREADETAWDVLKPEDYKVDTSDEQATTQQINFTQLTIHTDHFSQHRTTVDAVDPIDTVAATSTVSDERSLAAAPALVQEAPVVSKGRASSSEAIGPILTDIPFAESLTAAMQQCLDDVPLPSITAKVSGEEVLDIPRQFNEVPGEMALTLTLMISDPAMLAKLPPVLRQQLTVRQEVVLDSSKSSMPLSTESAQSVVPRVPLEAKKLDIQTSGVLRYQLILTNTLLTQIVRAIEESKRRASAAAPTSINRALLRRFMQHKQQPATTSSAALLPPPPSQTMSKPPRASKPSLPQVPAQQTATPFFRLSSANNVCIHKAQTASQPGGSMTPQQRSTEQLVESGRTYSSVAQGQQPGSSLFRKRTQSHCTVPVVNASPSQAAKILERGGPRFGQS